MAMNNRLMRPKVSNTFNPSQLTGLSLWLDAAYGASLFDATSGGSLVTADSSAVARWEDRSGNGRHFTQSTANNRPLLRTGTNGKNSLPILEFDGSNDSLFGDTTQYTKSTAAFTVFIVFNVSSTAGQYPVIFATRTNIPSNNWRIINSNVAGYSDMSFGSSNTFTPYKTSGVTRGTWYSYSVTYNGSGAATSSNYAATTNGSSSTLSASGVFGTDSGTNAAIGCESSSANFMKGNIAELCVYSQALSAADLAKLQTYAKSKWGIY